MIIPPSPNHPERSEGSLCHPERIRRISVCHPERSEGSHEILRAKALRMTDFELFITMTLYMYA